MKFTLMKPFFNKVAQPVNILTCIPLNTIRLQSTTIITSLKYARSFYFQVHLHLYFWIEYILSTINLINHLPTPLLSWQTLFERLYDKVLFYSHLRVFMCLAYVIILHVPYKFIILPNIVFFLVRLFIKLTNSMTLPLIKVLLMEMLFFIKKKSIFPFISTQYTTLIQNQCFFYCLADLSSLDSFSKI